MLRRFKPFKEVVWTAKDLAQFHKAHAAFFQRRNQYVTVEGEILNLPIRRRKKVVVLLQQDDLLQL